MTAASVDVPVDIARLLLVSQAGLTIGFVVMIAIAYFSVWTATTPRRGLLPVHVVLISFGHSMLVLYATFDLHNRLGEPMSWRIPFLVAALCVSDAALVIVMTFERARIRHIREDHPRRRVDDL